MNLADKIRNIPDFPKPGIQFKDITTLLKDGAAFRESVDRMADLVKDLRIDVVAGPEARGFVMGAPLAYKLGVGFVPIRKAGKLPGDVLKGTYQLEYGQDTLEIHRDGIRPGQNVLVVDDLLATGGTIKAAIDMVRQLGGNIPAVIFLIELTFLEGRKKLEGYDVKSVIQF